MLRRKHAIKQLPDVAANAPGALQATFDELVNSTDMKRILANYAGALLSNYQERMWQLLIGDDTSGRPVAYFGRHVLRNAGIRLPMAYVCTSQQTRKHVPPAAYREHFEEIATQYQAKYGQRPERVLYTGDSVGSGRSATMVQGELETVFPSTDYAFLVSSYDPPRFNADHFYLGASGWSDYELEYRTFEGVATLDEAAHQRHVLLGRILPDRIRGEVLNWLQLPRTTTSYPLHGLMPSTIEPIAIPTPDMRYQALTNHVYATMGRLAQDVELTSVDYRSPLLHDSGNE